MKPLAIGTTSPAGWRSSRSGAAPQIRIPSVHILAAFLADDDPVLRHVGIGIKLDLPAAAIAMQDLHALFTARAHRKKAQHRQNHDQPFLHTASPFPSSARLVNSWRKACPAVYRFGVTHTARRKRRERNHSFLSEKVPVRLRFLFPEVALEEAGEGLAVPGFVAGHLIVPLRFTIKGVILQHNSGSFLFSKHIVISFLSLRNYFLTTFYQLWYSFVRVSTATQRRNGNSLEDQVAALTSYGCQEIIQEAFTGKTMERPEFTRLLSRLNTNDTLVVTKLDRFARTAIEGPSPNICDGIT